VPYELHANLGFLVDKILKYRKIKFSVSSVYIVV
jgi:hypothetical protein